MTAVSDAPAPAFDPHATPEAASRLRRAQLVDRFAGRAIRVGGIAVLAAVVLIFVFVGSAAVALLRGARVDPGPALRSPATALAVGTDEYRSHAACVTDAGEIIVIDTSTGVVGIRERLVPEGRRIAATAESASGGPVFFVGADDGTVQVVSIVSKVTVSNVTVDAQRTRSVEAGLERGEPVTVREDGPITRIAAKVIDGEKAFVAVADVNHVALARFKVDSDRVRVARLDTPELTQRGAAVTSLAVALMTDVVRVYAGFSDGRVVRWDAEWTDEPRLHEAIEAAGTAVTSLSVLLGGETLVCGAADGSVSTWFGVRASPNAANWDLTRIRTFPDIAGGVAVGAGSSRAKSFVALAPDGSGRIDYATSGATRADIPASGAVPTAVAFTPKNDGIVIAANDGTIRLFDYADPHPESGVAALFSKIWYEGGTEPEHKWQSTGGTDDFEPKLSVTTLVFGTLKGVFYALLFSVPLALLAAIYTALYLPSNIKAIIKPTLEVMAALPSVVIGLLAALWLSPIVERNLAATFAMLPAFLVAFAALCLVWAALPRHTRTMLTQASGVMWLSAAAVLLAVLLAVTSGPWLESGLFGGDVKAWLRDTLGLKYDARNAMVVGFAMGFAVIPVIFTIAEDAISNVPKSLWAASEALGASRWQTTIRVVLPAATPGIFAALMLGFGRAVGETMIVLMATGNTPILDMSPFNGMRTISACIAVEIPEAPEGGTLYRVLFLSGTLLFIFTFCCNTIAEVVGSRLRRRYGRAG